ncbi:hypothetical protein BLJAPNOD_04700 [Ensifer sp. M14]|uniref:hemerythrin domain-containing protein n=1 Tax=Ensifer sp. M14 TaxID=2203782 RepID=UPI000E1C40A3|nr:hypothetical protein BLJAPNOD_04700 [Ensifer sp. M14]
MNTPASPLNAAEISRLETLHRDLLAICLRLEEVAADIETSASEPVDPNLAEAIPAVLREAHNIEEKVLFPDFNRNAGSVFAAQAIGRLKADHRCDLLTAEEISLVLRGLADGQCDLRPDNIARLLHGFQEALRRHIHAESLLMETLLAAKADDREVFQ